MKLQKYAPDLFLVQQVSGRAQLNQLTEFMSQTCPAPTGRDRPPQPASVRLALQPAQGSSDERDRVPGRALRRPAGLELGFRSTRCVGNDCVPNADRSDVLVRLTPKINGHSPCGVDPLADGRPRRSCVRENNARQAAKRMAAAGPAGLRILGGDATSRGVGGSRSSPGPSATATPAAGPDRPAETGRHPVIIAGSTSCSRATSPRTRPPSSPTSRPSPSRPQTLRRSR